MQPQDRQTPRGGIFHIYKFVFADDFAMIFETDYDAKRRWASGLAGSVLRCIRTTRGFLAVVFGGTTSLLFHDFCHEWVKPRKSNDLGRAV